MRFSGSTLTDNRHNPVATPSMNKQAPLPSSLRPAIFALALAATMIPLGCAHRSPQPSPPQSYTKDSGDTAIPPRCSAAWNVLVDRRLGISDASGHGPDIGSTEWQNAVSRKSGVTDSSGHGPDAGSDEWCRAVDYKVFGRR